MPITPVFEQPPVVAHTKGIDWTAVIDALNANPGEWAKVDGPFPNDKNGQSNCGNHAKSLRKFGARGGHTIETQRGVVDGENWVYARLVAQADTEPEQPAPAPKAKERRLTAAPDPAPAKPPSSTGDSGGDHECDECDAKFRTNIRLRQHQANAHKAS